MNCGCTMQHSMCAVGGKLFASLIRHQKILNTVSGEQREKRWEDFYLARIAYTDHVQGWRQGDVRVLRSEGKIWRLERRQQEQWAFQFGMIVEETLQVWLKEQGFWRYAQIDGGEPQDRLTGYYHQRNTSASKTSTGFESTPATTGLLWQDVQRNASHSARKAGLSFGDQLSAELDQKTDLALLIAVLVGRYSHPLTPVDRLYIQRKAVSWLLSSGVQQIKAGDMQTIAGLIEKAISMRAMLEHARSTTLL